MQDPLHRCVVGKLAAVGYRGTQKSSSIQLLCFTEIGKFFRTLDLCRVELGTEEVAAEFPLHSKSRAHQVAVVFPSVHAKEEHVQ